MGNTDDGLVFISYSHYDRDWLRRLLILLGPLVRNRGLRVWADEHIRVGEDWRRDITAAVEQARLAILLVSGDFLNSSFIMDEELPALKERGVRLAPILVHDCLWDAELMLASVQWVHDPDKDGPLDRSSDRGGRDRRLAEICRILDKELVPTNTVAPTPADSAVPLALVDRIALNVPEHAPGCLDGVPSLPRGYRARAELDSLVEKLLGSGSGAVGLTGDAAMLGLFGQGGIGKSVQANAVARDDRVRSAFPDGVYWVAAGERSDLVRAQVALLDRLGAGGAPVRTPSEGRRLLEHAVSSRRVLLIIDDVWSDAAALAFRVTGSESRMVYTTRDASVLASVGAEVETVDVLPEAASRQLLADVSGVRDGCLPADVDRVLVATGRVPLALALVAATVRSGTTWESVIDGLDQSAATFLDHPYADTFKALQVATDALSSELADAYLSLAVYPRDSQIPVTAITRYWHQLRGIEPTRTWGDLQTLADRNLLLLNGDEVEFHDLQHDYLLLHVDDLPLRHADLLVAYQHLLPEQDAWWQLPSDEPYIADNLLRHMSEAGYRGLLIATVTDPAYLMVRTALFGPRAAESDLLVASKSASDDARIAWLRQWLAQIGYQFAEFDDPADLAPTFASRLINSPQGIDCGRLEPLFPPVRLVPRWGVTGSPAALLRVLAGHTGKVSTVVFSPAGKLLATASYDETIRLWDITDGRELARLPGHTHRARMMVFSPDGSLLVTTSDGAVVRLWNVADGREQDRFVTHANTVNGIAFSPDGKLVAVASEDESICLWNITTGEEQFLTGHTRWVNTVAFCPDGKLLASASNDGTIRLWDIATCQERARLSGHASWVKTAIFSPGGEFLATAGNDETVRLWNVADGRQQFRLDRHTRRVSAVVFSPNGGRLATASPDETVRLWDVPTGHELTQLIGRPGWVKTVAFSPDGELLATASNDETVRLWSATTGEEKARLIGHLSWVNAAVFSPNGAMLATTSNDETVRLWDTEIGQLQTRLVGDGRIRAVAFGPRGELFATVGSDRQIRLWDVATGKERGRLADRLDGVTAIAFTPDGRSLAISNGDAVVRKWEVATGNKRSSPIVRAPAQIDGMTFSTDGNLLATTSHNETILWETINGSVRARFVGDSDGTGAAFFSPAAFSPDDKLLAIATSNEAPVRLWSTATGDEEAQFLGHAGGVTAVAFSPDGKLFVSTGKQDTIIWRVSTGQEYVRLDAHVGDIYAVAFSPDGKLLVTVGGDRMVRVWGVSSGESMTRLLLDATVDAVDWSVNGIALATNRNVTLLDLVTKTM